MLDYKALEQARPTRTSQLRKLNNLKVHEIIEYYCNGHVLVIKGSLASRREVGLVN